MDDLISRQAAIDALNKLKIYRPLDSDRYVISDCLNKIVNLPSAQPEQRWIPCSRRLPDDLAEVNVTYVNHDPEPYYVFTKDKPYTASAVYYKGNWYWYSSTCADYLGEYGRNDVDKVDDAIEITAWKPLPEPYRGDRGDRLFEERRYKCHAI